MLAVRLHTFGPAENLSPEEVADPAPGPGQVRIAVAASGVHLVDTALREGLRLGPLPLPELPTIPGREIAGTVDALGAGTGPEWLGRRVVAHLGQAPGGYAQLAVADAGALHPLPEGLSAPQAVAMIGTGRTTMGLVRDAGLGPDSTVLVLAAAGGIGSLLVQYAKHHGARVVGAAGGTTKASTVAGLGADLAVDYDRPDWPDRVRERFGDRPVTHLFEGVGGERGAAAIGLVASGGTHFPYGYASTGFAPDGATELPEQERKERGISVRSLLGPAMQANRRALETEALAYAAAGVLSPLVQPFPLAEAAAAHRALQERGTIGKVVLVPGAARPTVGP